MAAKTQPEYYDEAEPAVRQATAMSLESRDVTHWVTLQPAGWCVKVGGRCPDIRSVPFYRVRNGGTRVLMEYVKHAR